MSPSYQTVAEPAQPDLRELRGLIATVNTTGLVEAMTAECMLRLALHNASLGFTNIEYQTFPATLVESGRDAVCQHALSQGYDWLLMIDGDATFGEDAFLRLLHAAFIRQPDADAVGAYSQLKGSFLPTIDTGSGTWEPHFPGEGLLRVIRTGGHFILVKTPALRRFGPPWWRTREAWKPARALAEVDNFARMKLDGKNPLAETPAWRKLTEAARGAPGGNAGAVGEDSGFCDALTAAGGRIYVDTDTVTGHIDRRVITPGDLKARLAAQNASLAAACGIG